MKTPLSPSPRKPSWLIPSRHTGGERFVAEIIRDEGLATVCREARCPNRARCAAEGTATVLILGRMCTRACGFCAVGHGTPDPVDREEPARVAEMVRRLGLRHAVVTSVTRDDLPDGGAGQFAAVIRAIRKTTPDVTIEVLTPDFRGKCEAIDLVAGAAPEVFAHNLETVRSLTPAIRSGATYERSLAVLAAYREIAPGAAIKSGLMLGLGEKPDDIRTALDDLLAAGCNILTLGQYLRPTPAQTPVVRYVPPEEFDRWRDEALKRGFSGVAAGPLVRSSFQAASLFSEWRMISARRGQAWQSMTV